jgi:hypothetical protein
MLAVTGLALEVDAVLPADPGASSDALGGTVPAAGSQRRRDARRSAVLARRLMTLRVQPNLEGH